MMSGFFFLAYNKNFTGAGGQRATQNAVTYEQRGVTKLQKQIAIVWRSVIVCDSIVFCLLAVTFGLVCTAGNNAVLKFNMISAVPVFELATARSAVSI